MEASAYSKSASSATDLTATGRPQDWRPAARHVTTSARFRPDCANCSVRGMCLPSMLRAAEVPLLDFIVVSRRSVRRGQMLYHAGDPCEAIYPVHAGFFKTTIVSRNGDEQVTGLRMAGDIIGLDGIATHKHTCDAIAVDQAEVCVVPVANLLQQSLHDETLQRTVYGVLSREIERQQDLVRLLGSMWGIQRVATFLLDVSERTRAHGYSPVEFELRLTRREIGSYLGMELETVSRIVSRLERERLIAADRGHIRILDAQGLARVPGARHRVVAEAHEAHEASGPESR